MVQNGHTLSILHLYSPLVIALASYGLIIFRVFNKIKNESQNFIAQYKIIYCLITKRSNNIFNLSELIIQNFIFLDDFGNFFKDSK